MTHIYLFDIDGTLYSNKYHEIDPELLQEFQILHDRGDKIYLVSSRSPYEMRHLPLSFLQFPFNGLVLEGGAASYDQDKGLIDARLIPNEDVKAVRNYCRDNELLWRYSGPDGNFFNSEEDPAVRTHWRKLYMTTPMVKPWIGDDVCNILIWTKDEKQQHEIRELLPESSLVFYSSCVEIRAKGVSKEDVLERIRKNNEPCRIFSFGDGMNDIEMLKRADHGVAVGNACDAVKAAADEVIDPVWDNGVTKWLKLQRQRANI